MGGASKFVVSGERSEPPLKWGKFAALQPIAGNDVHEQIKRLKRAEGGDIMIFGSPTLVRSLTEANLIDEYQIQLHPVVVTVGGHLFDAINARKDLSLVAAETLRDGSIVIRYEPAKT